MQKAIARNQGISPHDDFFGPKWPMFGMVGKGRPFRLRIYRFFECKSLGFRTIVETLKGSLKSVHTTFEPLGLPPVKIFGFILIYGLSRNFL